MILTGDCPVQCLSKDMLEQLEKQLSGPDVPEQRDWSAGETSGLQRSEDESIGERGVGVPRVAGQTICAGMVLQFARDHKSTARRPGEHRSIGLGLPPTTGH